MPGGNPLGSKLNALAERYYEGEGCQKPLLYLAEYERLFAPMRHKPLRLLELGVRFGASMFVWRDYFPQATILGLDIDNKPAKFPDDQRIHFLQGSQDDPAALDRCVEIAGGNFDIIVDDASHIGHLSAAAFTHLFPRALKPGGYYVIEDICTSFLIGFPDSEPFDPAKIGAGDGKQFRSHRAGMVGVIKQIFDHAMAPVAARAPTEYAIESMTILPNIAIIRKSGGKRESGAPLVSRLRRLFT
jgi:cephalosporin hydroxylase